MIKATQEEIEQMLRGFTGTMHYYDDGGVIHTDGIHWLAESLDCRWLIRFISSCQSDPRVSNEEFQVWKLTVAKDDSAILTCTDGNDDTPRIVSQEIAYTSFPLEEITLFCELGSIDMITPCFVLMLPSER